MRHFVRQAMRGLLFCLVTIAVTACANLIDDDQSGMFPALQSEGKTKELARIDKIRMRVAQNALSNGDYDTAIRFFDAVHESTPAHPLPLIGLGEAKLGLGLLHEAETAYRAAVRIAPNSPKALEGLGTVLVSRGAFEDAIAHFNRSLAQAPSASLHNKLGVAHDLKGDGVGAQRNYRAALALDPNIVSARNNLALSLVVSESYGEAVDEMELAAAHPESTARHQQNLAFVYGMAGRFDEASATLRKNGLTGAESAEQRALFDRMREMAKKGRRTELLAFLRNAEPGDNLSEAELTQSAAVSPDLSGAVPESSPADMSPRPSSTPDTLRQEDKVLPPNSFDNNKKQPYDFAGIQQESASTSAGKSIPETRMARLSDPAQPMAEKPSFSLPDVDMARGSYRVQLAAYRTLQRAGRGQNVLVALLRQDSEKFHIFGHKSRTDGESGFSFRIRTAPFETREEGLRICDEIRTYGHDGCLVIKHNDEVWEPLRIEQSAAQPVRVQLASFRTEKGAQKGQKILKDMLGDKAGELEILARDPASGDPKSFDYKIRTAPLVSPKAARELCEAYKAAGHADCIVIRQNDSLWKRVVAGTAADQAAMPNRFRIQLASYRSKENADAGRKRLAKLVGDNISPLYILTTEEFVTASDQKYYRILVSQVQSRIKAIELCKEVRAAGHDQCLIVSKGQN